MSDTAKIDYISRIDFTKDFQRYHIKWPLNDLTKPKHSSIFETKVADGDRNITLSWSISIEVSQNDPTHTWFGARLKTSGKITPIVYRMCLTSSNNVLFDCSSFAAIDGSAGYGKFISPTEFNAYSIEDLMLHYWIDIPFGIVTGKNSDELNDAKRMLDVDGQNSHQKACNDVLLFDHGKVFSRVVDTDSDPSSDFSVIIVNKKDEELRRFHCHTLFLSARCDVFERMFASEKWKETCVKNGRSVKINDISAQVMETVLRYIYTSTLPDPSIDRDYLCGIIFAADKYNLPELKNWCAGVLILKHPISILFRIEQLILADRHNLAQLKAACLAQLSLGFSTSFSHYAILKDVPSDLWPDIIKAMTDRQLKTVDIALPKA